MTGWYHADSNRRPREWVCQAQNGNLSQFKINSCSRVCVWPPYWLYQVLYRNLCVVKPHILWLHPLKHRNNRTNQLIKHYNRIKSLPQKLFISPQSLYKAACGLAIKWWWGKGRLGGRGRGTPVVRGPLSCQEVTQRLKSMVQHFTSSFINRH